MGEIIGEAPLNPLDYLVNQPPQLMDFATRVAWMYGWLINDATRDYDTIISTLRDLMDDMGVEYEEVY